MADFKIDNYNDVATRIVEFREKFPQGSLQQVKLEFVNVAGKDWVVYTAAAFRSPDDQHPGIGTAWEPIPGKTPYTRDSEVMVAETSAWGRAMVAALAVDTRKGVASADEVRNRQTTTDANPLHNPGDWSDLIEGCKTKEEARELYTEARRQKAGELVLKQIEAKAKTLG